MVAILSPEHSGEARAILEEAGESVRVIGEVAAGEGPAGVALLDRGRAI